MKKADLLKLIQLLGRQTAIKIKKEVGINIEKEKVPKGKRKGQLGLGKY